MSKGSITPLGPKKWKVRVQSRDKRTGRKVSRNKVVHGTEAQARRALDELKQLVRAGAKPQRLKLRAFSTSWIASRARAVAAGTMKPSVARKYANSLDRHILPVLGDMYLDALTQVDVQDYVTGRIKAGAAGNTVLNELRCLRTIARDSFAAGAAPRYWADRVKAPEVHVYDEDDPNALTPIQLRALIPYIPAGWLALFGTMAFTGLRWGEASALRWEDLDHESGLIRVRRSNWRGRELTPKTKKSRRSIAIPPYLVPPSPGATGYIFPTRKGTLHRGTPLNKVIRRAREKLNEKLVKAGAKPLPRLTPHGLRRTYNDLLRAVAPALVVKAIAGWSSDAMPAHYSTVRADEKQLAARRVLELVGIDEEDEAPPTREGGPSFGAQLESRGDNDDGK